MILFDFKVISQWVRDFCDIRMWLVCDFVIFGCDFFEISRKLYEEKMNDFSLAFLNFLGRKCWRFRCICWYDVQKYYDVYQPNASRNIQRKTYCDGLNRAGLCRNIFLSTNI